MSARPGETVEGITVPKGDPDALLSAGRQLEGVGVDLGQQAQQVAKAPSLMGSWAGPGSSTFADLTGNQANVLQSSAFSVLNAGLQISISAGQLQDAQTRAQHAIKRAEKAREEINDAREALRQALDDEKSAQDRMAAATLAREAAEMKLLSSAIDSLLGDGSAQAAIDAANAAYTAAETDLHEAERREKRARIKLKHAEDDLRDARKDGQDAADDAESIGILLQSVLHTVPAGVLGSPGVPAEAQIAAAGNVPKPQPQKIPISQMEPPKDWPGWKKALFKVGRGEMTVIAGTVSTAKKAYDNPEKIPGGLAALGSHAYHDPLGTAKQLVDYDDLANGRPFDWIGGMGIGFLSGGAGTIPARGSRLTRVIGSPKIEGLGRTPFPINSRKFAGTKMDFRKPDFGARPGTGAPNISEAERLRLAAKYPDGVRFTRAGYPVFTDEAVKRVHVPGLTGDRTHDANLANQAINRSSTPAGYVWHHVEDGRTMELVPRDLHNAARHSGGATAIQNGQVGLVRPGGVFTPFERGGAIGGGAAGFAFGGPAEAGAR
jgi:hypothetical protein